MAQKISVTKEQFKSMKYEEKWKVLESFDMANQVMAQQLGHSTFTNMGLLNENNELKIKNQSLTKQVDDLHILLKQFDELKQENESLRKKIDELEKHICKQDEHIYKQNEHINKQDEHIKKQNEQIKKTIRRNSGN